MFADLILLKSGNIVYYGPTDEVQDFFAKADFPVPPLTNIADHIMDVIQPPLDEAHLENLNTIVDFGFSPKEISIHDKKKKHASKSAVVVNRSTWFHQFVILLKRSYQEQSRQTGVFYTQLILNILIGLMIGTVYLKIGNTQTSVVRRSPALFFCAVNQGIFGALITINSFPRERLLTLRERAAGSYYSSAYFLSKILVETLFQLVSPIIFSCVTYFLVGLQLSVGKFFIFTGFMVLCSMAATSLALMVSTLARTTDMAVTVLPMALEVSRLYGGFFLSPRNLPDYFKWLDALSYVKYAYVGVSLNELSGLTLICTEKQLVKGVCPITSGEFTIDLLGLDQLTIGSCAGGLVAFIVGTRFVAYLGIRFLKK
jgi:ATP-binding cassette subfamily G (WHITE) protein 2